MAVPAGAVRGGLVDLAFPSDPLTERSRRVWSAGDYDRIANGFRAEAAAFVARRNLAAGMHVLDAACGSGNVTIPAARSGADVVGFDLMPELLERAAAWALREDLTITLREGSVEAMPFGEGRFDVVLSMFGVMFAARPDRVMAELGRVTRPGGVVALANWTRSSFIGRMLAMHSTYAPPPAGVPSPLLWGDEDEIHRRFDPAVWDVTTTLRTLRFHYPHTPAGTVELFRAAYGPTVRTFEGLDEDRRAALAAELTAHWVAHHRAPAPMTEVDSEYLEVVAARR